jgi:hypothetical protein
MEKRRAARPASESRPERVLETLLELGLLLLHDARLPSVSTLVAGEPVRGSWWGHPRSHAIFRVATFLGEHRDVVVAKLVSGKVTFLHRDAWPALAGVGTAREPWQMRDLGGLERALLERVDRSPVSGGMLADLGAPRAVAAAAKELERRLLVHGESVHTESGAHATQLESWRHWAQRAGFGLAALEPEAARAHLENLVGAIERRCGVRGRLPWQE